MPDAPIPPALTPDEWAAVASTERYLLMEAPADRPLGEFQRAGYFPKQSAVTNHQQVALANAALPDGDPRKLTREDVACIAGLVAFWETERGVDPNDPAHRVVAKLNALLPDGGV